MSASLVEMVLAIALAGLVFVGAIVPTTQSIVAYQEAEAELRFATAQASALIRAEQVAGSVWRDAEPPPGHAAPKTGKTDMLQVGDWSLRGRQGRFEQRGRSSDWSPIAQPIGRFSFRYLLADGSWKTPVSEAQLDEVLAVRFDWRDTASGRRYGGLIVAPDRAFAGGLVELPQPDTSTPYRRADYQRRSTFSLGSW